MLYIYIIYYIVLYIIFYNMIDKCVHPNIENLSTWPKNAAWQSHLGSPWEALRKAFNSLGSSWTASHGCEQLTISWHILTYDIWIIKPWGLKYVEMDWMFPPMDQPMARIIIIYIINGLNVSTNHHQPLGRIKI